MSKRGVYIVAIGASAGGLEAIHEFFDHMPQSSSFSFIVIQHLSSDYKSLLVELVAKHTHMKVFEAGHNMTIQQDCVYIIPNNKLMTVSQGRLKLAEKSLVKAPNTAIDTFLHTLAEDKKELAIAVLLSGTGTDGTKGIQTIKEKGGMVIVQDPSTAKFDGMPNSAIASGNADYVLSPKDMPKELFNYANELPVRILENGYIDGDLLDQIFVLVYEQSGNDFSFYKTPTIVRRIARRMTENGIHALSDYVGFLKKNAAETEILGKDFLIGVTKFFRDPQAFDILESKVLPDIVSGKSENEIIKVWICACSTGQEAYSVAILLNECIRKSGKILEVKIFATDIDEKSIEIAARNQYPNYLKKEIKPGLFKKYFTQEENFFSVNPEIRKQIVFARHDVIKSPPFIKNDLVNCRNMLIYMNNVLQEKVLSTFHFSLNKKGYLFLGSSETAGVLKEGINEISGKWKLYQKSGPIHYSNFNTYSTGGQFLPVKDKRAGQQKEPVQSTGEVRLHKFIAEELGFAGVFIDKGYLIKEAVGNYKKFLSLPDQKMELNVLKMVSREIAIVLNNALRRCWKEYVTVHLTKIRMKREEEDIYLNISIQPPARDTGLTMIVFRESVAEIIPGKEELALHSLSADQHSEYIYELEAELNETRNNLQVAVEQMETTNEELQSTNEELLSANEELQSGNEELQSLNEELHTLNTEHQLRIKELVELNDDLDNYFRCTDIGQVFLDNGLYIRKFNPAAVSMVNLIDADIGRSIEHISNNVQSENFIGEIRKVLLTGHSLEKEVALKNGTRSLMRILPYVRQDKKNDGVVVTFVDISQITALNNLINGVFNASLNAIFVFTAIRNQDHFITDFKCVSFNNAALSFFDKSMEDFKEALLVKQIPELSEGNLFGKYIHVVEKGGVLQTEFQSSALRWFHLVAVKMSDGFVATLTDITDQKAADQKIKKNYNELISVRENLKKLNTELELKVKERTMELSESEERFKQVSRATNDTIWDWTLADNTIWRSDNFTSMFGYEQKEENGNIVFWFDKIHPEDRKRVQDSVYDAINRGEPQWSAEYRVKKTNGHYAVILDRGTIMKDDFQTPYRMVGSMVDITTLIETENKLTSSERKFRKIFDSNVIGMLFCDIDTGNIEDANDAFIKMIGYSREDLDKGLNWSKITPEEYMPVTQVALQQIKKLGVCPPFEKQYLHKDGHRISVMIGSALLEEGNDREAVTYIIDISKQKQVEDKKNELQKLIKKQQDEFYRIFKKAPALITIRRGPELVYEFVNDAFLEFNGDKGYIGHRYLDIHPELHGTELLEIQKRILKTGEVYEAKAFHVKLFNPVNQELMDYWFDFIFTPVYTDRGEVDGIAFFGFEVTDLLKAQKSTKELMQRKDEFMSIASHELKTPITSIKGFLQLTLRLAKNSHVEQQMLTYIYKANRQLDNLTALVNDLLDVTRIQAGKMQFNYSRFNIKDLILECTEDIQNTEDYVIEIEHLDDLEIYADEQRIQQVLNNFLSNAIKYSPQSKRAVIYTEVIERYLKITVKDFGIGIPSDKAELVFDRFFRVNDDSFQFSGLGLGLYISSDIVRRHNGSIGVNSEENKGSEFWFKIPIDGI
ncbi:chemotaxis protein [Pedobacter sp. HMWF019]|uniref:chemotaxis protein CheB n=1 Tax=Pedobacter sp. HMWF019 TaxID=2056856 RepID=UPI000D37F066|nr:chemotaxis protein CheB [Pedobacter sp. HMWF019]PTT01799.1 chemotaxis protein [Pedobacter sp. HMWF019]